MKNTKRILAVLLVAIMVIAMNVSAFADTPGKITISNSAKDAVYNIYKVFDATINATGDSFSYSTTKDLSSVSTYFTKDAGNNVSATAAAKDANGMLTADAIAALATLITPASPDYTVTGTGDKVSVSVAYGFYYIINTAVESGSVATVTTANTNAVVIDKNTNVPDLPEDDPLTPGSENFKVMMVDGVPAVSGSYSYGDIVDFKISFTAVNFITKANDDGIVESKKIVSYAITDVPTGLVIDPATVAITVNGDALTKDVDYTVSGNTYTIAWVGTTEDKLPLYDNNAAVEMTYKAEVRNFETPTASNDAKISYTDIDGNTVDITPEEPDPVPETTITNHKLIIDSKYVKPDATKLDLADATYSIKKGGTTINLLKTADGEYRVAVSGDSGTTTVVANKADGTDPVIKGLGDGTYTLVVEHSPEGYNKLAATDTQLTVTIANADKTAEVDYTTGTQLPTTGSTGVALFTVFGSAMIVVAGLFLVTNKRMSKEFN